MVDPELEFKIQQLERLIERWKRFYGLYRKILKPGEATPKEEDDYEELATTFARMYTPIATRVGISTQPGAGVLDMVTTVPDAEAVRDLSEMQRRKFEGDWRTNNTAMNQKLGELQLLREELVNVSEFAYYTRRWFSNKTVQWTVGASVIIILLGIFGFFNMFYRFLDKLIARM